MITTRIPELIEPEIAVSLCQEWLQKEGANTSSGNVLSSVLNSLAGSEEVDLSQLRMLDAERRLWVASIITGLHFLSDKSLLTPSDIF